MANPTFLKLFLVNKAGVLLQDDEAMEHKELIAKLAEAAENHYCHKASWTYYDKAGHQVHANGNRVEVGGFHILLKCDDVQKKSFQDEHWNPAEFVAIDEFTTVKLRQRPRWAQIDPAHGFDLISVQLFGQNVSAPSMSEVGTSTGLTRFELINKLFEYTDKPFDQHMLIDALEELYQEI